jgi:hypothetical protein
MGLLYFADPAATLGGRVSREPSRKDRARSRHGVAPMVMGERTYLGAR